MSVEVIFGRLQHRVGFGDIEQTVFRYHGFSSSTGVLVCTVCMNSRSVTMPSSPWVGSCTLSLRLIRQHEIWVEYPSFTTCGRGFCHGRRSLFLPAGAGCPGVAVPHAPVGMAQRHRRVPDDTGAP